MKLPYVTIEYREEESFALGKVSWPLIVGFGLHWTWIYLVLFNGMGTLYPNSALAHDLLFTVSLLSHALTLLLYGILLESARKLFSTPKKRRRNRSIAAVAMAAGTALVALSGTASGLGIAIAVASGLLTGIGSAVLIMSFAVSFSVCDIAATTASTAASLLAGAAFFALTLAIDALVHPLGAIVCIAIPLLEVLCLDQCSKQLVDRLQFSTSTIPVHSAPFALHVCTPNLVFGFVVGLLRSFGSARLAQANSQEMWLAVVLAGVAAAVLAVMAMLTQRQSNNFMFRTQAPVIAVLFAVIGLFGADGGFEMTFAVFAIYMIIEACVWVMYADISQRFRISSFTAFGFGRGMLALGTVLGFALSAPESPLYDTLGDATALLLMAFVAITLGVALLPTNAELRRTLKLGQHCPALAEDDFNVDEPFDPVLLDSGNAVDGSVKPAPATGGANHHGGHPAEDADTPVATGASAQPDAVAAAVVHAVADAAAADGMTAEAGWAPQARDGQDLVDAEAADADAPDDAGADFDADGSGAESDGPAGSDDPNLQALNAVAADYLQREESQQQRQGHFKRKCAAIAERYLLSRKETEVLFLLAKGRNSAYIQETLYISAGTANTHMRHIYRKLNVHSQQELIKMVDSEQVEQQA